MFVVADPTNKSNLRTNKTLQPECDMRYWLLKPNTLRKRAPTATSWNLCLQSRWSDSSHAQITMRVIDHRALQKKWGEAQCFPVDITWCSLREGLGHHRWSASRMRCSFVLIFFHLLQPLYIYTACIFIYTYTYTHHLYIYIYTFRSRVCLYLDEQRHEYTQTDL